MNRRTRRIFCLLMGMLVVALSTPAMAAQPPLVRLLKAVPAAALDSGAYISYADYAALLAALEAIKAPAEEVPAEDETAFRQSLMHIQAGYDRLMMMTLQEDSGMQSNGFAASQVQQSLVVGNPPFQQVLLSGAFNLTRIQQALANKGYQALATTETGWQPFCAEGDCTTGNTIDVSKADPAFLFGGMLGSRWPLLLRDDLLLSTPHNALFLAATKKDMPSVAAQPGIAGLLSILTDASPAPPVQFILLPAQSAIAKEAPGIMYLCMQEVWLQEGVQVQLALSFASDQGAAAAGEQLKQRYKEDILITKQPFSAMVEAQGGKLMDVQAVALGQKGSALLVSFQFPAPTGQPFAPSPFRLFYSMMIQRDMQWLVP